MTLASVDSPARFLQDLKKILLLQRDFGIESYPRTVELDHFLASSPPLAQTKSATGEPWQAARPSSVATSAQSQTRSVQTLADIQAECGDCQHCPVASKRVVFGTGNPKAALFIVGACPNLEDEQAGVPFSGEDGELLTKMLVAIGLQRSEVYLTTIVKCRSAGSAQSVRDRGDVEPSAAQIKACLPFLFRQIDAVGPKVICTMGQLAAQAMLRSKTPLIRLRGNFHDCQGVPLMPTFDPTFLLKNQEMKKATWIDLQLIQAKLAMDRT